MDSTFHKVDPDATEWEAEILRGLAADNSVQDAVHHTSCPVGSTLIHVNYVRMILIKSNEIQKSVKCSI